MFTQACVLKQRFLPSSHVYTNVFCCLGFNPSHSLLSFVFVLLHLSHNLESHFLSLFISVNNFLSIPTSDEQRLGSATLPLSSYCSWSRFSNIFTKMDKRAFLCVVFLFPSYLSSSLFCHLHFPCWLSCLPLVLVSFHLAALCLFTRCYCVRGIRNKNKYFFETLKGQCVEGGQGLGMGMG